MSFSACNDRKVVEGSQPAAKILMKKHLSYRLRSRCVPWHRFVMARSNCLLPLMHRFRASSVSFLSPPVPTFAMFVQVRLSCDLSLRATGSERKPTVLAPSAVSRFPARPPLPGRSPIPRCGSTPWRWLSEPCPSWPARAASKFRHLSTAGGGARSGRHQPSARFAKTIDELVGLAADRRVEHH